ncbi:MAG: hypothetical protein PF637_13055 [Spirochaetes bacterium]|jgi:hypothetical protein|nr:hypothetical protein [Spirochaetota bacterium]
MLKINSRKLKSDLPFWFCYRINEKTGDTEDPIGYIEQSPLEFVMALMQNQLHGLDELLLTIGKRVNFRESRAKGSPNE